MCGIAGIHLKVPGSLDIRRMERLVNELALGIEPRGDHATGLVAVEPGGKAVSLDKAPMPASQFIKVRRDLPDEARTVLIHTRLATQGPPEMNENNHPVLFRTCFAIHNGHISNDRDLFQEYDMERTAAVDSQAIAAALAHHGFDNPKAALEDLKGGFAIAAIDPVNHPDRLLLAKGPSSPLVFFENSKFLIWASTWEAIKEAWARVLGTPPDISKAWQLKEGQFMVYCGAERTELSPFEVKPRYTPVTTNWYGNYGSNNSNGWMSDYCKDCGHTRMWHGRANTRYSDSCEVGHYTKTDPCECKGFVEESTPSANILEKCDCCYEWVPQTELDMDFSYGNFTICKACSGDEFDTDPTTVESDSAATTDSEEHDGATIIPLDLTQGTRKGSLNDFYTDGTRHPDEQVHRAALRLVASETGHNVAFIDWLLFDATSNNINNETFLAGAFDKCDPLYAMSASMVAENLTKEAETA